MACIRVELDNDTDIIESKICWRYPAASYMIAPFPAHCISYSVFWTWVQAAKIFRSVDCMQFRYVEVSDWWTWLVAAPKLSGIITHGSPTPFEGIVTGNNAHISHIMLIIFVDWMGSWTPASVQRRLRCIAHSSDLNPRPRPKPSEQWAQSQSVWEHQRADNRQDIMLQFPEWHATIVNQQYTIIVYNRLITVVAICFFVNSAASLTIGKEVWGDATRTLGTTARLILSPWLTNMRFCNNPLQKLLLPFLCPVTSWGSMARACKSLVSDTHSRWFCRQKMHIPKRPIQHIQPGAQWEGPQCHP
jgi:hypothetical protein